MAYALPRGYTYGYDQFGNLTLVPIGTMNALQVAAPLEVNGSNPSIQVQPTPFQPTPFKPTPFQPTPFQPKVIDLSVPRPVPVPPRVAPPQPQIAPQVAREPDPYPDAPNPPRTYLPPPASLPQFDDTQGMREAAATPSTLKYIAGQLPIGFATGGHTVADANQAELYQMGFPVDPPTMVGPDTSAKIPEMNQEVYGRREVVPPNAFAKYAGTAVNALASNPYAFAGGGPSAGLRGVAGAVGGTAVMSQTSQAAADLFPDSRIAPLLGALAPMASLAGARLASHFRSPPENVLHSIPSTDIEQRLAGRHIEGVSSPDATGDYTLPPEAAKPPALDSLPLDVRDEIGRASTFNDPNIYAKAGAANKLPVDLRTPEGARMADAIETKRLADQWQTWKDAGYFEPTDSAGAARTGDYSEGHYIEPEGTITPNQAASDFADLTGHQRMIDTHGKLADAVKAATDFQPNADIVANGKNGSPRFDTMPGETPEQYMQRVSESGLNGAQHIQLIQQELQKAQPLVDDARSAKALRQYQGHYTEEHGGPDMTNPVNATKTNLSDFLRKVAYDRQNEHMTGQPFGKPDPAFPDAKPLSVMDISEGDIGKIKALRDGLNDPEVFNAKEQQVIRALQKGRQMLRQSDPYSQQQAMDNMTMETGLTAAQFKEHLGNIQDKLGYQSADPKDLAEYFYYSKKLPDQGGSGGGSVGAAKSTPEEVANYTPTTTKAARQAMVVPKTFTDGKKLTQSEITAEMARRFALDDISIQPRAKAPPPKPEPSPYTRAFPVTGTGFDNLTPLRKNIAQMLASGMNGTEIEGKLGLPPESNAMAQHFRTIYSNIGATSRTDAILKLNEIFHPFDKGDHPAVDHMTQNQQDVAGLLKQGTSTKDIADKLGLTYNQAAGHIAKIAEILGTNGHGQTAAALNYPNKIGRRRPPIIARELTPIDNDILSRMRKGHSIDQIAKDTGKLSATVRSNMKDALGRQMGGTDADLEDFLKNWYQE